MKKYKMHIISIIIIILMLFFALSTTRPPKETDLTIENRSSKTIKLRITRYDEYTEEFILHPGWEMELKRVRTKHAFSTPDDYLKSIIIYNEDGEILKEYNKTKNSEAFSNLTFYKSLNESKNWRIYYFSITNELLE
jgi:ABC-type Fe3+-hydroxamate transport system substrate-binding protein